jgi:hypothetical protein
MKSQSVRSASSMAVSLRARLASVARPSLMVGTALGCSIAIMAAAPGQAWAADECGPDVAGVATCTAAGNPYPSGINYTGDAGEDITLVVDDSAGAVVINSGGVYGVNVFSSANHNASITIDEGVTVTTTAGGAVARIGSGIGSTNVVNNGALHVGARGVFSYSSQNASVTNNGDITVDGSLTGFALASGIQAYTSNVGYDATVIHSGTITVVGGANDRARGVEVDAAGGVAYTYISGAIDVTGVGAGTAIGAAAFNVSSGSTRVTTSATGVINTSSDSGYTYGLGSQGSEAAYIDAAGAVTVNAVNGHATGAYAAAAGLVQVDVAAVTATSVNGGALGVSGRNTDAGSDVTISITGPLSVNAGAEAIGANAAAADLASLTVTGDVTVVAAGAATGLTASGDSAYIDAQGSIVANAIDGNAYGAEATARGSVSVLVEDVSVGSGNGSATGVSADSTYGVALVNVGGGLSVVSGGVAVGASATGVAASVSASSGVGVIAAGDATGLSVVGTNSASVTALAGVSITTNGGSGTGLDARSDFGPADATAQGPITVLAAQDATGVKVEALTSATASTRDLTVGAMNDGAAMGASIYSRIEYASATVDGSVTVSASGLGSATGVDVSGHMGALAAVTGAVYVVSDYGDAYGIRVATDIGEAQASAQDLTVTAGGHDVRGIQVTSDLGDASVSADNVLVTGQSDFAAGVIATAYGGGQVASVTVGSIVVSGDTTLGASAESIGGQGSVRVLGDVYLSGVGSATGLSTFGSDQSSISVDGDLTVHADGVAIGATASGGASSGTFHGDVSATSTGDSASGLLAMGIGSALIRSYGDVTASGETYAIATRVDASTGGAQAVLYGDATATSSAGEAVAVRAHGNDLVLIHAEGAISATGETGATGAYGDSELANVTIQAVDVNAITNSGLAQAVRMEAGTGSVDLTLAGGATAQSTLGSAFGVRAEARYIDVEAYGDIAAAGTTSATGVYADGSFDSTLSLAGVTAASASGVARDVYAHSDYGSIIIDLAGAATATSGGAGATALSAYADLGAFITVGGAVTADGVGGTIGVVADGDLAVILKAYDGITVTSSTADASAVTLSSASGVAQATITGDVVASAANGRASGILLSGYVAYATVSGEVYITGDRAFGEWIGATGSVSTSIEGDLTVLSDAGYAIGLHLASATDSVEANIDGGATVVADGGSAYGLYVTAADFARATIAGSLQVEGLNDAYAIEAHGGLGATVTVTGDLGAVAHLGDAYGVIADSSGGTVGVDVDGLVNAYSFGGSAHGVVADANTGAVIQLGALSAGALNGGAFGVDAQGGLGSSAVLVYGSVNVAAGNGDAFGIRALTAYGSAGIYTGGPVDVDATGTANGLVANGALGADVHAVGGVTVSGNASRGVIAYSTDSDATVTGDGAINVQGVQVAGGIGAYGYGGYASVDLTGDVTVHSDVATANGVTAYGLLGANVDVVGAIDVTSDASLATGVLVNSSGGVDVTLNGAVSATGRGGATGVYAAGDDDVNATVTGATSATSATGTAFGIQAVSRDADVDVSAGAVSVDAGTSASGVKTRAAGSSTIHVNGDVTAYGSPSAWGIDAYAEGDNAVTVAGDITVDADTGFAEALQALSNTGATTVFVDGDIDVDAQANFMAVVAWGETGLDVEVTGALRGDAATSFGYGMQAVSGADASVIVGGDLSVHSGDWATAIRVQADGYASLDIGGELTAVSSGSFASGALLSVGNGGEVHLAGAVDVHGYTGATGVAAVLRGGNLSVNLDNGVTVLSDQASAVGVRTVAFDPAGETNITVSGGVSAVGEIDATGVHVEAYGPGGASITLAGDVIATAHTGVAMGVDAHTDYGDATLTLTGDVTVGGATATGLYVSTDGFANQASIVSIGDVSVTSDTGAGSGVVADGGGLGSTISVTGDVTVNSGNRGTGVLGQGFGPAAVSVAGATSVNSTLQAIGVQAASFGDATVSVSGDVTTDSSFSFSTAVRASAYQGDAAATVTGDIRATSDGDVARGVSADTTTGDAHVIMTGDVTVSGATGYGVRSVGSGASTMVVDGDVSATGTLTAQGLTSQGLDVSTVLTGDVTATGASGAVGVNAVGQASVALDLTGDIHAVGDQGNILAVNAHGAGSADIDITGDVTATGTTGYHVVGIQAAMTGAIDLDVAGAITVTDGDNQLGADYGVRAVSGAGATDVTVQTIGLTSDAGYAALVAGATGAHFTASGDISSTSLGVTVASSAGAASATVAGVDADMGLAAVRVDAFGDASIMASGDISDGGLWASSQTGAVTVTSTGAIETVFNGGIGARAVGPGDVAVSAAEIITHGSAATGVLAQSTSGAVNVDVDSVSTFGASASGIDAASTGLTADDGVTIAAGPIVTSGLAAGGIVAQTTAGDIDIDSASVTTLGDAATAIHAASASGAVNVTSGTVGTAGAASVGVAAYASLGFATVDSASILTLGADSYGLVAYGTAGVRVDSDLIVTHGDGATGLVAESGAALALVYSGAVSTFGDYADAVVVNSAGDLELHSQDARTSGDNSFAIAVHAHGQADVDSHYAHTTGAASTAIYGYSETGDVAVTNYYAAAEGAGADAIRIDAGGDASVVSDFAVLSDSGDGISITAGGQASITLDGAGVQAGAWAIHSDAAGGTYILNEAFIVGGAGRAIDADGGAAHVVNDGAIYGRVDLTDNADQVVNNAIWDAYGDSDFGAGADVVTNAGLFAFGHNGAAGTTTLAGLESFDNRSLVSAADGQADDVLAISGDFHGGTGSQLAVDVELGGAGSTADRLVIGSASGVTEIVPVDLLSASTGVVNIGGILVVDSPGAGETGDEFQMDSIDKGLIEYSLRFDSAAGDWLIVGLPDIETLELLGAMSGAQDFSARSTAPITARWEEVRDSLGEGQLSAGPGGTGRSDGWELWMQAHGGAESFDHVETILLGGLPVSSDLSTRSDWRGFQFGADNLQGNTLWGLTMGFNQQETTFEADQASFDFEGWNVGAYLGWGANGFFVNGLVKGDFFEQDTHFNTLPTSFSFDGTTWGAMGEAGYRWNGEGLFFEPSASLAWSTTSLDGVAFGGASVDFDNATSLLARAGARLGGTYGSGEVVMTPWIGAFWVDELEGDNALTLSTGPSSLTFADQGRDAYGQIDLGVTVQAFHGLEGSLKGEWNVGGDADGGSVRLGVRWRW